MSFITFGETMLRLTPSNSATKIKSSRLFQANYAGSESYVSSSLFNEFSVGMKYLYLSI